MPHFVILRHDWPDLHWDLMLESSAALRTWRLSRPPDTNGPVDIVSLPNHRLAYLDYEGPVSGNRGSVQRLTAGQFEIRTAQSGRLEFTLECPLGSWVAVMTGEAAVFSLSDQSQRQAETHGTVTFREIENSPTLREA